MKTVLITGGASGIGLLCGQCYARQGDNVVLVDINQEALDARVEEIRAYSENVLGVCIDIRDYESVKSACKQAWDTFGSIDILINCAGGAETRIMGAKGKFHEIPIEVYDFGGGVIIHLGSITGQEGCSANIAYAASKSALMNGMTKAIAKAGAEYNVRCCYVAPGPVLTRPAMANMKTLMGRAAETQEVVDLIMYLASDKASFITGSGILADCGRNVMDRK